MAVDSWTTVSALLCGYGFLKELRPSEPFLTEYLIEPQWANITLAEAYNDVYPVWTYSFLAILVVVFLVTDLARYKPVIVVEGIAYIVTWCLLLWGKGVPTMQLMQFTYGIATSTEVAYFTYIYAKVDARHYRRVTSWTRVALLLGRFASGVAAQALVSSGAMDYRQLNVVSLVSVCAATAVACALPSVDSTLYFHRKDDTACQRIKEGRPLKRGDGVDTGAEVIVSSSKVIFSSAVRRMWSDLTGALSDGNILRWSVWWALAMCGNFQVGNYIQPLWETIAPVHQQTHIYNGAVEAVATILGAAFAFLLGYVHVNWSLLGEPLLFLTSAAGGAVLVAMASTDAILVAYVGYVTFRALYQTMITVASFEVARNLPTDSYGLVFGFNTFLALAFQSVLTLVVADDVGLALEPRMQFLVYGGYWCCVGALFLVTFVSGVCYGQGPVGFYTRVRTEGIWIKADPGNVGPDDEEAAEQPPIGSTEPL